jgi:hypothetical protein
MSIPSSPVEDLLRRTFAEVAERTTVAAAPAAPHAVPGPARGRWQRQLAAAAALVVLVVGGLFVLTGRDAERPAGRGTPTRVVPSWGPRFATADGDQRPFALTELTSTAERDRVTYSADAGTLAIELDRTRSSLPDGTPTVVRGTDARRGESSLAWIGPGDAVVEVTWSGEVTDEMVTSFVQAVAEVDDATWAELTATGGFRERSYEALAEVRVDADVPFTVEIVGDLHEGLSLQLGNSGFRLGYVDRCASSVNDLTSDFEADVTGYLVLAPGDVEAAVIRPIGDDDRVVEMTSLLPLADVSIGGVVYEGRSPSTQLPRVDCEEGS